jgi:hypothetical protein
MAFLDKFLKRSTSDGQVFPTQFYKESTDEMVVPCATDPLPTKNNAKTSSASCARPDNTTAYDPLEVVGTDPATNLTFSNIAVNAGAEIIITRAELEIDVSALPSGMTTFTLHLYDAAPTPIADRAAYNLPSGDRAKYKGYIDFAMPKDLGDTLYVQEENLSKQLSLATGSTTLYGILQTITGYPPTAQAVKKVTLHALEV